MLDPLFGRIQDHANRYPDKCAVICGAESLTYSSFLEQIINWLSRLAKDPEQSVACLLPNSAELLSLMVATSHLGHNLQVISPDWPSQQIKKALQSLQPDMLILDKPWDDLGFAGQTVAKFWTNPDVGDITPSHFNSRLPFYTGFTSGSTGEPKGFVRSQLSWLESFYSDQKLFQFCSDDVFVIPGSLSHSLPLYGAVRGLYQGGTVYVAPIFRPDRILRDCIDLNATVIYATPTQYRAIMDQSIRTKTVMPTVRKILTAGSKFPVIWFEDLQVVFPASKYYEFYGTSELSYVTAREMKSDDPQAVVGKAMHNVSIRILNEAGELAVPTEVGRIFVKSPFLFSGYTREKGAFDLSICEFQDGYLCVGDRGFLDHDGVLHLVGRMDRVFQSSGRNIDPDSIESVLSQIDGIDKCAVIGMDDDKREKRIAAVLALKSSFEISEFVKICSEKLPKYLIPTQFYICEDWPITNSFKTDYLRLNEDLNTRKFRRLR